jgi:hypothetical protein
MLNYVPNVRLGTLMATQQITLEYASRPQTDQAKGVAATSVREVPRARQCRELKWHLSATGRTEAVLPPKDARTVERKRPFSIGSTCASRRIT